MARTKSPMTLEAALPAGGKPTLKTIAQMSGLAVPTVSRALNDAPDIGSDTKVLVRKIAAEIGYVPNRAGVRLRTGRTNVISLVMSTEHDNHTARLISSVAGGLQGTRYHLNVMPYFPQDDFMKPVRYIVETASADAVILNQIEPNDPRVAYLMEKRFPFATHGRSKWADKHAYYDFDNHAFGYQAMEALHARGRRNVIVVAPPLAQSYAQHLVTGLRSCAERFDIKLTVVEGATSDNDIPKIVAAVHAALVGDPTIDAIATASTTAAMAAVSGLEQNQRVLGTDIDVIAKEAIPFLKLFRSEIITLSEAVGTAGEFLARAAIKAIQDPAAPPMQYLEVPQGR
ncbi:LacI family transcriptional regulator [Loktanella sp. F6476L]|uniref:LacI family transcriptional regulator n=1 Tax=Loktanella sp. F6476L TaxID=2926405 RepID=UPI001FF3FE65|nr:LacI family transcriptional regulator [Loktanella sp. F6476L]MCK0121885.1 LacI family transcriptional regulator [Loktanella sp. F6476L]